MSDHIDYRRRCRCGRVLSALRVQRREHAGQPVLCRACAKGQAPAGPSDFARKLLDACHEVR